MKAKGEMEKSFEPNEMASISRFYGLIAGLSGFLAVALGAFGAHALRGQLTARYEAVYQTAVQYQMFHTLALVGVCVLLSVGQARTKLLRWSARCFLFGLILFCGSLYALVLSGQTWLGMITPLGGLAFMAGWLCLAWSFKQA